jgi:hypothetical protein
VPFEYGGSMRAHAVTARPEAQGGKRTGGDVFVNALAAHFPVRRELRDRDISGRVSLEIDDGWHDASLDGRWAFAFVPPHVIGCQKQITRRPGRERRRCN